MAKKRNSLRAGIFIVVSLVLAFVVVINIRGLAGFVETMQLRTARFTLQDDLSGLAVGDDMRLGGFKVGEVRKIEVVRADDPRLGGPTTAPSTQAADDQALLLVTFSIPNKYELRQGARIGIQSTVTGQACLNIDRLGTGELLPADVPLVGQASAMSQFMGAVAAISPDVKKIMGDVSQKTIPTINGALAKVERETVPAATGLLTDARTITLPKVGETFAAATRLLDAFHKNLDPILAKYYAVGNSAIKMMDSIGDLFGGPTSDLRGTLANLNSATGELKKGMPHILDDVRMMLRRTTSAIEDIQALAKDLKTVSGSARTILADNKDRIDSMIKELNQTAKNMEAFSAEISHRPYRLLSRPTKGDDENFKLLNAAREFARGASEMNDAANALKETVHDPAGAKQLDPDKVKALQTRLEKSFDNFRSAEDRLWKELRQP